MSFDSLTYLIFLPAVYAVYLLLNRRGQNVWLLAASYLFYGWWDVRFLFLIILSTAIDYCCGLLMERGVLERKQYAWSAGSLVLSVALFLVLPGLLDPASFDPASRQNVMLISAAVALLVVIIAPIGYKKSLEMTLARRRRAFLYVSLVSNFGILGIFKYFDFFVSSAEAIAISLGVTNVELLHLNVILPVGISFYTFQTVSYSIDVYRGGCKPTDDYISFSLFVTYFPQLVAGPIERASNLLPAILSDRIVTREHIASGVYLILLGLFKKIGISNGIAISVNSIYNSAGIVSTLDVALATMCFAIQIYCDFSGYSDIARGSSKLFGIDLMRNFAQPYFSANPSEFWRRWHISLSTWLRDYLYISLGGNRGGEGKTYRNLMTTMVLGGLWHGAAWNFVLWGVYQGLILCAHRYFTRAGRLINRLTGQYWNAVFIAVFFCFTCYGWLLFRANSLEQVIGFTGTLLFGFDFSLSMQRPTFSAIVGLLVLAVVDVATFRSGDPYFYRRLPSAAQGLLYAALLFVIFMGMSNEPTQFIYFQF